MIGFKPAADAPRAASDDERRPTPDVEPESSPLLRRESLQAAVVRGLCHGAVMAAVTFVVALLTVAGLGQIGFLLTWSLDVFLIGLACGALSSLLERRALERDPRPSSAQTFTLMAVGGLLLTFALRVASAYRQTLFESRDAGAAIAGVVEGLSSLGLVFAFSLGPALALAVVLHLRLHQRGYGAQLVGCFATLTVVGGFARAVYFIAILGAGPTLGYALDTLTSAIAPSVLIPASWIVADRLLAARRP